MRRFYWARWPAAFWPTGMCWPRWPSGALVYGGAVIANLWIPKLPAARPGQSWRFTPMTHSFFSACKTLWRNGETRFSLMGTSLFWGAGVTLRFLLVLWVPAALGIHQ
ncbi:Lysophospholipid transporter lplT [Raoultella planticola]|uniref:Lysophospholipid transporter lplT n=1 Tax=Raoultella planticola TaxID=575 RepID=A0A485C4I1_RAOPL|nr:Lysophospholipid transporter lplT [Raoultella planticola]